MHIIICDDDTLITNQLSKYVLNFFERNKLKTPDITIYYSGEALLNDTSEKDIVFLDIEMPGMNGIHVGNELKRTNPETIVFVVTSYMEYLDEAMRFHVFRYLSKPIDKYRLFRNLRDALQIYSTATMKIPIETKTGVQTVSASDIVSIEAFGRKITVHTTTRDYETIRPMQYWIKLLPQSCFFQSHRSYIVNLQHVMDFDKSLIHLYNNQFDAYLTRRKYTAFKDTYLLYLESTR